jgi:hypothetical protein
MPPRKTRAKPKAKSLDDVIKRHNEVTLQIAFVEALLDMSNEHFVHHDGLEPKSLVVTHDGRRVPETIINQTIQDLKDKLLNPLTKELASLKKVKL